MIDFLKMNVKNCLNKLYTVFIKETIHLEKPVSSLQKSQIYQILGVYHYSFRKEYKKIITEV